MDNRDFRVRAFLYIVNEGVARGFYNHIKDVMVDAVDINPGCPNAELRTLVLSDSWKVTLDLAFPPDKQGAAIGLFNQAKNIPAIPLPNTYEGQETGFASIKRCGHRIGVGCEIIENHKVE